MALTKVTGDVIESSIDIGAANVTSINVGSAVTIDASGVSVTGVITASNIIATNGTFSGNVSVAGTVTYEDVTNVDSIGVVTARSGVRVGTAASTGTANQTLQVTGGAYVSGNVGIGSTNPGAKLDVHGPVAFGTGTDYDNTFSSVLIRQRPNNDGYASLSFYPVNGNFVAKIDAISASNELQIWSSKNSSNGSRLNINMGTSEYISFSPRAAEAMRIVQGGAVLIGTATSTGTASQPLQVSGGAYINGSVGIGTTNPAYQTDLWGNVNNTFGSRIYNSNSGSSASTLLQIGNDTNINSAFLQLNSSSNTSAVGGSNALVLGHGLASPVVISTNGTERLRVTGTGSIGIGVTNPSTTLQVNGTSAASSLRVTTTNPGNFGSIQASWSGNTGYPTLYGDSADRWIMHINPHISYTSNGVNGFTGTMTGATIRMASDTSASTYWDMGIGTNSVGTDKFSIGRTGNSRFTIDSNGYVATPNNIGAGLDIGYKKSVSITGTFSANTWYNTGIDRTTDTGIYLLDAYVDTYGAGGQSYQMRYIGWFVLPSQATNSGDATTITTHRAGHAPNAETIQFRTLLTANADSKIYLQWLSNFANTLDGTGGKNIQIVIHRFATPLGG